MISSASQRLIHAYLYTDKSIFKVYCHILKQIMYSFCIDGLWLETAQKKENLTQKQNLKLENLDVFL